MIKAANLVVIELKRTEEGGRMELQAIRYAAMVSTMTFDQAANIFEQYLIPRFLQRIERARKSLRAGRGVRLEDI